jgi:type IV pilus assembly protein PilB
MTVQFDEEKQDRRLGELKEREEEDLARIVADRYGLEYVDLSPVPVDMDALRLIPEAAARDAQMAPFSQIGKRAKVAVLSPTNEKAKSILDKLDAEGYTITLAIASPKSLEKVWARYADLSFSKETSAGVLDISTHDIEEFMSKIKSVEDIKNLVSDIVKLKKGFRISKILEIVLSGALATKASDVHIEPEEENVRLRLRLDGVLTDILMFDKETYGLLLSRIKLLSGLKLNVKNEAQDGRFSVKIGEDQIEIRTSILPGAYNESIVMRILNPKSIQVPLEDLGISEKLLKILLKEIDRPNGMILTTGPTGSGKTTTLYAFLRKIYSPEIKIITIEDPIEYHLGGIVQTQVHAARVQTKENEERAQTDYTFASGLRSALRQDPDVIMVGEIRDEETAGIAINSSLTGHLVFSTLHTNDAAGTYPRLIDLGINPKILTSAINVALAQRLVRKLCSDCKKKVAVDGDAKKTIDTILAGIVDRSLVAGLDANTMYQAVGCIKCNNLGYRGRTGLYEAILTDEALEKVVVKDPSSREIREATRAQGILDMREDGVIKVLTGMTSLDELRRVIDLE